MDQLCKFSRSARLLYLGHTAPHTLRLRELRHSRVRMVDKVGECLAMTPNVPLSVGKLQVAAPGTFKAAVVQALFVLLGSVRIEFLLDRLDA